MVDKLFESIQKRLQVQGLNITTDEVHDLYIATLRGILELKSNGSTVDISNFGSFWEKQTDNACIELFTPDEQLLE